MIKTLTLTIILSIVSMNIMTACTCGKVSYTFMDKIHRSSFVAMVEVIGKDTIKGFAPPNDYAFTVVKIIDKYAGKYAGKEIKIIDSKGYECFIKLRYKNIGDRFIVKGAVKDVSDFVFRDYEKQWPKEDILALSLCSTNQLYVDGNDVKGWITKNKNNRWWRWSLFIKKITFGLIDREKKGRKEIEPQKMGIERFKYLLNENIQYNPMR